MEVHATAALLLHICRQIMLQSCLEYQALCTYSGALICSDTTSSGVLSQAKQAQQHGADWMFGGSGAYAPHPGSSAVDMKLRLHETVHVFDIGLAPHPARALLDSGTFLPASMHGPQYHQCGRPCMGE